MALTTRAWMRPLYKTHPLPFHTPQHLPGTPILKTSVVSSGAQDSRLLSHRARCHSSIISHISATTTAGASTTLSFSGDAVKIYGSVGPHNAPYQVELDGGSPVSYNATKQTAYEQVLLYYADNLGPGQHNVQMTNTPSLSGQSLNINYALIDTVPSVPSLRYVDSRRFLCPYLCLCQAIRSGFKHAPG